MFGRNKDTSEIFDERWKANHNDDVKKARVHEKEFINRMFDVQTNSEIRKTAVGNMQRDFENLNKNIAMNNEFQRQNRFNNKKGNI